MQQQKIFQAFKNHPADYLADANINNFSRGCAKEMKSELWLIGKNEAYVQDGLNIFVPRIKRYVLFEIRYFEANRQSSSRQFIKSSESKMVLGKLEPKDYLVLLDERGKEFTSEKFAGMMNTLLVSGTKKAVFLIGGAYGVDDSVCQRANAVVALSKLTFSHQVARLIFAEQLYRAFTILNNEPYHHA